MRSRAITIILTILAVMTAGLSVAYQQKRAQLRPGRVSGGEGIVLPVGWRITPAGRQVALPGDMAMKIIVSPDGRQAVVNTAGWHDHSVNLIDIGDAKLTESINVAKDWTGMAQNPQTGEIFVSGGGALTPQFAALARQRGVAEETLEALKLPVLRLGLTAGRFAVRSSVAIEGLTEKERFIAGVTLGADGALYVVNIQNDTVYRLSGEGFSRQQMAKVGYRPYAAALAPDGRTLAVSNWGDESVSLLDAATLAESRRVKVGSHPNDLAWSRDGRLFVANSGSNSISVLRAGEVVETIRTSLDRTAPVGSSPISLAITADGRRL
ncbi:MAG: YncE family protein, partial [Acidobacteria bacterium]|nr:YncE family protein [Acidobacteriota bacterium]